MDRALQTAAGILLALSIYLFLAWLFNWPSPFYYGSRYGGTVQSDGIRHFDYKNGGYDGLKQWCDSQNGTMNGYQCIK
ncbi:MAG: hypothetical protein JWO50_208 [Candidatus Kaiserbacteria bacterium]|nr:hypothetical protein [Candidatus Kaiserbacteria bacterium]